MTYELFLLIFIIVTIVLEYIGLTLLITYKVYYRGFLDGMDETTEYILDQLEAKKNE